VVIGRMGGEILGSLKEMGESRNDIATWFAF
jgi:hypothetical protein